MIKKLYDVADQEVDVSKKSLQHSTSLSLRMFWRDYAPKCLQCFKITKQERFMQRGQELLYNEFDPQTGF